VGRLAQFHICPFTVVVDSREQHPFSFRNIRARKDQGGGVNAVKINRQALRTGDYSIEGLEDVVAIERKSMEDFTSCAGTDRRRFEKQLARLNEMPLGHIVLECDWSRLLAHIQDNSSLLVQTVPMSLISWTMRHFPNIHWWLMPGVRFAEIHTFRMLEYAWKMNNLNLLKKAEDDG